MSMRSKRMGILLLFACFLGAELLAQIGTRFPSERRVVKDPLTGTELVFLTRSQAGDSKIYQTHNQWTADGEWLIFRSDRVPGEALAVNESSGEMVQVTEGGYVGMLNVSRRSMQLYFVRPNKQEKGAMDVMVVDLEALFRDSASGRLKKAKHYQRLCATVPAAYGAHGDMALDAEEDWLWFRVGRPMAAANLPKDMTPAEAFGPRKMGAGPGGLAGIHLESGALKYVTSVPFQVGHVQTNPWVAGQIIFCWETGGKAPQRTWVVNADGSGLRPLYPESEYEWVTHEAVISPDEVAFAIMGHRSIPGVGEAVEGTGVQGANPGQEAAWGPSGTREKPTGLGIVNLNTREMHIAGQIPFGSGFWHVAGSADKRFLAGDDFARNIYLIDRRNNEMLLLSAGHKTSAADHPHPTFSPDGSRIQIQSAMLSEDGRSMDICIVPVPEEWLNR